MRVTCGLAILLCAACSSNGSGSAAAGGAAGAGATAGTGGDAGSSQLAVCADYEPRGGQTCTDQSQCGSMEHCFLWNYSTGCPYPPQCHSDADCAATGGGVCVNDPCFHGSCEPACTATSCDPGFECATSGHCVPTSCSNGYACESGGTCDPGSDKADEHGCVAAQCDAGFACPPNTRCDSTQPDSHGCSVLLCASQADCDCGVCMNGVCRAGPGYCGAMPG